jgi:release factor glutamine methyltransferase
VQIKTVFKKAVQRLKEADIPQAELEVSLLLAHALEMQRTELLLAGEREVAGARLAIFDKNLARRLAREPLAYIVGQKEFWSRNFQVSKDVLIPRPETEFLLEKTLDVLRRAPGRTGPPVRVLDLGTGSGVIAVVLALELEGARITAVDLSYNALKVARHNAKKHMVSDRIDFVNCSWFTSIAARAEFDLAISNPPYIGKDFLAEGPAMSNSFLQPEVGNFEPRLALDGGERGMQEIIRIAAEIGKVLKGGAWFFMEIGADQQKEVLDIFQGSGDFDTIAIHDDYAGLPRVLQACKR